MRLPCHDFTSDGIRRSCPNPSLGLLRAGASTYSYVPAHNVIFIRSVACLRPTKVEHHLDVALIKDLAQLPLISHGREDLLTSDIR